MSKIPTIKGSKFILRELNLEKDKESMIKNINDPDILKWITVDYPYTESDWEWLKNHYKDIFEIDDKTLEHLIKVVKKIALNIKDKVGVNDVNIINNNGPFAGQTVFHSHFHIIPRYENNNGYKQSFVNNQENYNLEKMNEILNAIKM